MPVFLGRIAVAGYIADELTVNLGCCVKTERYLNVLVLEVTVDGLGNTDNLNTSIVSLVVLGQVENNSMI